MVYHFDPPPGQLYKMVLTRYFLHHEVTAARYIQPPQQRHCRHAVLLLQVMLMDDTLLKQR